MGSKGRRVATYQQRGSQSETGAQNERAGAASGNARTGLISTARTEPVKVAAASTPRNNLRRQV